MTDILRLNKRRFQFGSCEINIRKQRNIRKMHKAKRFLSQEELLAERSRDLKMNT